MHTFYTGKVTPRKPFLNIFRLNHFRVDVELTGSLLHYSSKVQPDKQLFIDAGGLLMPVSSLYCHIYAVKQVRTNGPQSPSIITKLRGHEGW